MEAVGCDGGALVTNNCYLQQNTTASLLELYFNDYMQFCKLCTRAAAAVVAVNKDRSLMGADVVFTETGAAAPGTIIRIFKHSP